jgi:6,7-dimethyl-8-ribityllumazine synthase
MTPTTFEGRRRGAGLRIAVVASRFNQLVTDGLLEAAIGTLRAYGVGEASIAIAWVPGAFELPLAAQRLATGGEYDAVICLGAVIKGDTDHYQHVAEQCAAGIARVGLDTGVPVVFGVLTTQTLEQALLRATGAANNKGVEAADTAVEMADLLRMLSKPDS